MRLALALFAPAFGQHEQRCAAPLGKDSSLIQVHRTGTHVGQQERAACHTAVLGEDCYAHVKWAMDTGIRLNPEWYPGLTPSSSFEAFQGAVRRSQPACPEPCPAAAGAPATFRRMEGACRTGSGGRGMYTVVQAGSQQCADLCAAETACAAYEHNGAKRCELHRAGTSTADSAVSGFTCWLRAAQGSLAPTPAPGAAFRELAGACRTESGGAGDYRLVAADGSGCRGRCVSDSECVAYETDGKSRCELHRSGTARAEAAVSGYTCWLRVAKSTATETKPGDRVVPAFSRAAIVREVRVNNRCALPVTFREAGRHVLAPGESARFTDGVDMSNDRITLAYDDSNVHVAVLELNGMFGHIGQRTPKANINFVAQEAFIDLPLDVALWADAGRSRLACRDGRARCTFRAEDCRGLGDATYSERSAADGRRYGSCDSTFGRFPPDPRTCVGDYAVYVSDRCEVFDRDEGRWRSQARSVGYKTWGWKTASFSDGTRPSTLTGRDGDGPAVTYECWEVPCVMSKEACIAAGHTSVGISGFAVQCDQQDGLLDVAVLEVTTCPAASGGGM